MDGIVYALRRIFLLRKLSLHRGENLITAINTQLVDDVFEKALVKVVSVPLTPQRGNNVSIKHRHFYYCLRAVIKQQQITMLFK